MSNSNNMCLNVNANISHVSHISNSRACDNLVYSSDSNCSLSVNISDSLVTLHPSHVSSPCHTSSVIIAKPGGEEHPHHPEGIG